MWQHNTRMRSLWHFWHSACTCGYRGNLAKILHSNQILLGQLLSSSLLLNLAILTLCWPLTVRDHSLLWVFDSADRSCILDLTAVCLLLDRPTSLFFAAHFTLKSTKENLPDFWKLLKRCWRWESLWLWWLLTMHKSIL